MNMCGEIDAEHFGPYLIRHLEERRGLEDAGVIDEHGDLAEMVYHCADG